MASKKSSTTSDSKSFGSERTMAPRRIKDTSANRGRQTGIGEHGGEGRPPLIKK